jgi:DNA repair protein RadD
MMQLRPYQRHCVDAVYDHLRTRDDNPCAVVPTAGGKTPIMATICKDAVGHWNGRVLILAHVKELLEQTADKLRTVCPEVEFGIYSAGLKRRDTSHSVIVAGIQSVYKRACELDAFDLVLVDEAHLIPLEGEGMYRQFLADAKVINPELRIVGFTATPFRLKTGPICTPEGFLNHICYEVGVRELIVGGYLCPLITKAGINKADFERLHVRAGEFVADEMEALMDEDRLVEAACGETVGYTHDRRGVLIFATGVKHGEHIVRVLKEQHGIECGFVTGETPTRERDAILGRFRRGELKYLCNVNVLTTGFDAPHIDCVALVRPTMSPGLYYQMVGRGFRLHPDKQNCLVLDFGGNVMRHGPVDDITITTVDRGDGQAPAKECPECQAVIAAGFATCPQCGYEFPPPERRKHDAKASEAGILKGQVTTTQYRVDDVYYSVHTKRGASEDAPKSMRVDYKVGWHQYKSEWICFEHEGYARQKAVAWWRRHSPDPVPNTAERAVEIAQGGGVAATHGITVRTVTGDEFERITDYELGPLPEPVASDPYCGYDPDEIPF